MSRPGEWTVRAMSTAKTSDGQRRFALAEIYGGRLDIQVHAARVELGQAKGDQVRVRWTVPMRFGRAGPGPRFASGPDGLRIRCRRARLRVDIPSGMSVRVRVRRGQITSWGAEAELDLAIKEGNVACRELLSPSVKVRAPEVNLHFAGAPQLVDVTSKQVVIALPGGPYDVRAPESAEVTVSQVTAGSTDFVALAGRITVDGSDVRVLAAGTPLKLTGE